MNKIEEKHRGHYFGLIRPTLILKHKDAEVYIKRFYDNKNKKYNIYAVTKDYNSDEITLASIVERRDSQIRNKVKEA